MGLFNVALGMVGAAQPIGDRLFLVVREIALKPCVEFDGLRGQAILIRAQTQQVERRRRAFASTAKSPSPS